MKIRKQDICVLLFYYAGYSRIRNLLLRVLRRPAARFVVFHDITAESFGYFRENIYFLKRSTNVVGLDDYLLARLSSKKMNVVITFDDGYKSWLTYAIPLLQELGLPATFFVTSGFVGLSKRDEDEFMRSRLFLTPSPQRKIESLTYEDLRVILKKGFNIGGHTLNHLNLGNLRNIDQVRYEIAKDKIELERETGVEIEYFAYPSGAYFNPKINLVEVLKELGYKGAVTTVPGFNRRGSNPYLLHRDLTGGSMPGQVFRARVFGNYDIIHFIKERILKVLQSEQK